MTELAVSPRATTDLEDLGLDRGAHLLIERGLSALPVGGQLEVRGRDPALSIHLRAWARSRGHGFEEPCLLTRGSADALRWATAERAGGLAPNGVVDRPSPGWGLAARGALVEQGGPQVHFD